MTRRLLFVMVVLSGAVLGTGTVPSAQADGPVPWIAVFTGEAGASCSFGWCGVTADAPISSTSGRCDVFSVNLPNIFLGSCTFQLRGLVNFANVPQDACTGLGSGTATVKAGSTIIGTMPVTIVAAGGTMTWYGLDLSRLAVTAGSSTLVCSTYPGVGINMAGVFTGPANV